MKLSVIIVNWNTEQLLAQCLECVYQFLVGVDKEVMVIDNGSTDGSQAMVKARFKQAVLMENNRNAGLVRANNQGIRASRGEYVLLLNSDAFLFDSSLKDMIRCLDEHPRIGAIGPQLLNDDGTGQRSFFDFPTLAGRAAANFRFISKIWAQPDQEEESSTMEPFRVDWLSTACLLVRKKVFEEFGLFDEYYFILCEDIDFFWRLKTSSWQTVFFPAAQVIHQGGGSSRKETDDSNLRNFFYLYHAVRSWHYFFKKNYGTGRWLALKILEVGASILRILITCLRFLVPVNWGHKWLIIRYEVEKIKLNLTGL